MAQLVQVAVLKLRQGGAQLGYQGGKEQRQEIGIVLKPVAATTERKAGQQRVQTCLLHMYHGPGDSHVILEGHR